MLCQLGGFHRRSYLLNGSVYSRWANSVCFHLHSSIGEQLDSYLVLADADAEFEIFPVLASKIKAFFVYMSVASKKASI